MTSKAIDLCDSDSSSSSDEEEVAVVGPSVGSAEVSQSLSSGVNNEFSRSRSGPSAATAAAEAPAEAEAAAVDDNGELATASGPSTAAAPAEAVQSGDNAAEVTSMARAASPAAAVNREEEEPDSSDDEYDEKMGLMAVFSANAEVEAEVEAEPATTAASPAPSAASTSASDSSVATPAVGSTAAAPAAAAAATSVSNSSTASPSARDADANAVAAPSASPRDRLRDILLRTGNPVRISSSASASQNTGSTPAISAAGSASTAAAFVGNLDQISEEEGSASLTSSRQNATSATGKGGRKRGGSKSKNKAHRTTSELLDDDEMGGNDDETDNRGTETEAYEIDSEEEGNREEAVVPASATASSAAASSSAFTSTATSLAASIDEAEGRKVYAAAVAAAMSSSNDRPPAIGDIGYTFTKYFPGCGTFKGIVTEIRPGARDELGRIKDRRVFYEDGDSEGLSWFDLRDLKEVEGESKPKRSRPMKQTKMVVSKKKKESRPKKRRNDNVPEIGPDARRRKCAPEAVSAADSSSKRRAVDPSAQRAATPSAEAVVAAAPNYYNHEGEDQHENQVVEEMDEEEQMSHVLEYSKKTALQDELRRKHLSGNVLPQQHDDDSNVKDAPNEAACPVAAVSAAAPVPSDGNIREEQSVEQAIEEMDEDEQIRRAMKLSMQTAEDEKRRRQWLEEASPQRDSNEDTANDIDSNENNVNDVDRNENDVNDVIDLTPSRRRIPRHEYDQAIEAVIDQRGGWLAVDESKDVKIGNDYRLFNRKKGDVVEGGGTVQASAQYGRYTVPAFWRLIDVLEGRADIDGGSDQKPASAVSPMCIPSDLENDSQNDAAAAASSVGHCQGQKRRRSNKIPYPSPIRALVDIGHGIGVQVQQAGLGLGIPSRGLELMTRRNLVANQLFTEVVERLHSDPPDISHIEMRCADFSRAVVANSKTGEQRDEDLRNFLLCRDLTEEQQQGLVFFVNNAMEVFAGRSNNTDGVCLDALLAELFANMKVGGRIVTLSDITCHLQQNTNWFRYDEIDSGPDAVDWGNSSKKVYVLTKVRNDWSCQNTECPSQELGKHLREGEKPPTSLIVDEQGKLADTCIYCGGGPMRTFRKRTKSPNYAD